MMGVGRITTPELANKVIEDGKFDLVAIGRGQLADAQWVQKAREGRSDAIRQCIGCTQGCYDAVINPKFRTITCTRNPLVGLEYKGLQKAAQPKKVLIVGGGMGGMMAAEILQERGHTTSWAASSPMRAWRRENRTSPTRQHGKPKKSRAAELKFTCGLK